MITFQLHEHPQFPGGILTATCSVCLHYAVTVVDAFELHRRTDAAEMLSTLQGELLHELHEDGCCHKVNHDR